MSPPSNPFSDDHDHRARTLARNVVSFFYDADDPRAFAKALSDGDYERALAMTDYSNEEIAARLDEWRALAEPEQADAPEGP
jgi:hypothetical protein